MPAAAPVFNDVSSRLRMNVKQAPLMRIACLTALGVGLVVAKSSLGDESETSEKEKGGAPSSSEGATNSNETPRAKNSHSVTDDHVRHHGALGVLLSKATDGVSVVGVIPGSPAERAGLRLGDEIRYIDDQRIRTTQELIDTIGAFESGTKVDLLIRRNGKRQVVEAKLDTSESTFSNPDTSIKSDPGRSRGSPNHSNQPASRDRGASADGPGPSAKQSRDSQPQVSQRIRALERQIYLLRHELNELRYSQSVKAPTPVEDMPTWWNRVHHGEADDDPALFQ